MVRCLLLALGMLWLSSGSAGEATMPSPHGDIHYEYVGKGDGSVVLLVHGFSTPMWVWEPIFDALVASGHRVLRFDLYGRGGSERAPNDRLGIFHDEITTLLDGLGIASPVDVVGFSMGGAITASYAVRHAERVQRVALIAPFNTAMRFPLIGHDPIGAWLVRYVVVPIAVRWGYRRSFADADAYLEAHPEMAARFDAAEASRDYALALWSSLRNIIDQDQLDWYRQLGAQERELLLIWGEEDKVTPYSQAERVRDALKGATFVSLPEAGHLVHLERTEAVIAALNPFLD